VKAGGGLTIRRMVKLAGVSRAGYYRFDENRKSGSDSDMDLRDAISGSRSNGPVTDVGESPENCTGRDGR